jgi:hypothetical protein
VEGNVTFWMIPITAILGGIAVVIVSIVAKSRLRELEIKERIAMIERGLVPAPEADPKGFDRAMNRVERLNRLRGSAGARHRRAGITLMGIGFGLMVLIGFTDNNPSDAFGVGGFLVVIGLAFFVNALFESRSADRVDHAAQPAGSTPSEPPSHA